MSLAGVFGTNDGDHAGAARARRRPAFGAELFESPHSFEVGGQRILLVHDIGDVQPALASRRTASWCTASRTSRR